MQIAYRTSNGRVYAIGSTVTIGALKLSSNGGEFERDLHYGVIGGGLAQADFTAVSVVNAPPNQFAPGASHEYVGGVFQAVSGYVAPVPTSNGPPLDHSEQHRALVRGRAADLDKKGKYLEASALRATVGA